MQIDRMDEKVELIRPEFPELHEGQLESLVKQVHTVQEYLDGTREVPFGDAVALTAYRYQQPWKRIEKAYYILKGHLNEPK